MGEKRKRVSRWYFGGLASCGAACCTHPLDLVKVHLQTQQEVRMRMLGMAGHVIRTDGFLALYNGLSASLCRQLTYSLTRFAIYETVRDRATGGSDRPLPFYQKVLLGAFGGQCSIPSVCVCVCVQRLRAGRFARKRLYPIQVLGKVIRTRSQPRSSQHTFTFANWHMYPLRLG
uniref:Solute carrier family 25 member 10b n=1 Tax=Callorhinchus milii TaxID=7868 RepID=A0A4W3JYV1_CALMI